MSRAAARFGIVDHVATAPANALRELIELSMGATDLVSLAGGLPAEELFDVEGIGEATDMLLRSNTRAHLQYNATDGYAPLRARLGALSRGRGIALDDSQVVVTTGSQQAIDLVTRCLVAPGDGVIVERPTFITALQTFRMAQARLIGVESDGEGPCPDQISAALAAAAREGRRVKLMYLVPSFSNPTGSVMSAPRRAALLELAVRHDLTIIEDDPYGELWFGSAPPPAIRAMAEGEAADHVIYTSSLSKILSPGLRVGWMIVPPALEQPLRLLKSTADIHSSVFSQGVVEAYLGLDRLPGRIALTRNAYAGKCAALAGALTQHLGGAFRFQSPAGGMFLWGRLSKDGAPLSSRAFSRHALRGAGVSVVPGDPFFADEPAEGWLRLSFSQGRAVDLAEAARRLADAHQSFPASAEAAA